jgi:hypothetical protein
MVEHIGRRRRNIKRFGQPRSFRYPQAVISGFLGTFHHVLELPVLGVWFLELGCHVGHRFEELASLARKVLSRIRDAAEQDDGMDAARKFFWLLKERRL